MEQTTHLIETPQKWQSWAWNPESLLPGGPGTCCSEELSCPSQGQHGALDTAAWMRPGQLAGCPGLAEPDGSGRCF